MDFYLYTFGTHNFERWNANVVVMYEHDKNDFVVIQVKHVQALFGAHASCTDAFSQLMLLVLVDIRFEALQTRGSMVSEHGEP